MSIFVKDMIFLVLVPLVVTGVICFVFVCIDGYRYKKMARSNKLKDRIKLISYQNAYIKW